MDGAQPWLGEDTPLAQRQMYEAVWPSIIRIKDLLAGLGAPAYGEDRKEYGLAIVKCRVTDEVGHFNSLSVLSMSD